MRLDRGFSRVHHRAGTADEEGVDLFRIKQPGENVVAFGAVEQAVEQLDVLGLFGKEMMHLQPVHETVLEPS